MKQGLSIKKTEYGTELGLYWPRYRFLKKGFESTFIPFQNIVTYTEILSYNID